MIYKQFPSTTTFVLFAIDDLTNNTGWWTVDISVAASSSGTGALFAAGEDVLLCWVTRGEKGDAGSCGTTGTSGTSGT